MTLLCQITVYCNSLCIGIGNFHIIETVMLFPFLQLIIYKHLQSQGHHKTTVDITQSAKPVVSNIDN